MSESIQKRSLADFQSLSTTRTILENGIHKHQQSSVVSELTSEPVLIKYICAPVVAKSVHVPVSTVS